MLRLLMLRRMLLGLLLRYRSLWLSDHGLFDTALLLMLAPLRSGRRSRLPRSRGQIRRTRRRRIIIRTTIEVSGNGIFEHGYPTLDRRRSAADRSRRRPVLLDLVPQMPRPQFGIIVRRRRRGLLRNALPRPYDFLALVKRASHLLGVLEHVPADHPLLLLFRRDSRSLLPIVAGDVVGQAGRFGVLFYGYHGGDCGLHQASFAGLAQC